MSYDGGVAHVHKGEGLVRSVFNEDILTMLKGSAAIGHTRYSTNGGSTLRNAQPHVIETIDGPLAVAHNGNLMNAPELRRQLLERGVGLQTSSDTELMVHILTGAEGTWVERIKALMERAVGAYALTILTRGAVYGVRDPWGFRPLVVGEIDGGYVLASETCAFSTTGAKFVYELQPGEIVRIDDLDGLHIEQGTPAQPQAFCTFEHIYLLPTRHRPRQQPRPQLFANASDASWLAKLRSRPTWSWLYPTRGRPTRSDSPRRLKSLTPRA